MISTESFLTAKTSCKETIRILIQKLTQKSEKAKHPVEMKRMTGIRRWLIIEANCKSK